MIVTFFRHGTDGKIRYYTLHDRQPLLTARYALTVAWRTGNGKEREKVYGFDRLSDMDRKIRSLFGTRLRAGYRLLYSFSRNDGIVAGMKTDTMEGAEASSAPASKASGR